MKVVIPGGSGQVGTILARALHDDGHEVVVLSRQPRSHPWRVIRWDGVTCGAWRTELDGSAVVINLTGRSVNCRYTARNRQEILESRTNSTRVVGEAIARARRPPEVWLQASTATIYAHRFDGANDECSGLIGGDELNVPSSWAFSIDVARTWERVFGEVPTPHTRKVALRSAMTMSADPGGVFDALLGLVRCGLGGSAGTGRQFVSWVHADDFAEAIRWLIAHDEIEGAVNIASPNPLPNAEFMRMLRGAWGMPVALGANRCMLEIGALVMRTETELILKSRRVVPQRLLRHGFVFRYPLWEDAARDLCDAWRRARLGRPSAA